MPRVLRTDVYVAGHRLVAGTTPPEQYARRITNPQAWQGEDDVNSPGNDNDTSQVGAETKVVDAPPPGPTEGPQPRPAPGAGGQSGPRQPPRSGKGSGIDAWEAFAGAHGVEFAEGADRGDIIAACEQAGLIGPA